MKCSKTKQNCNNCSCQHNHLESETPYALRSGNHLESETPYALRSGNHLESETPHALRSGNHPESETPYALRGAQSPGLVVHQIAVDDLGAGLMAQNGQEVKQFTIDVIKEIVEQAHMAGQISAGIDPSFSNAQQYCEQSVWLLAKKEVEGSIEEN